MEKDAAMENNEIKKQNTIDLRRTFPWLVCLIPLLFAVYCCMIKSGYYLDEYYSYGFSNSTKGVTLLDVFDGNLIHKVITPDDLLGYITAGDDEDFGYSHIFENCAQDMTPPLYYCILHTICSFFPGIFSKWLGLGLNLIAFFVTLYGIYYTSMMLYRSRWVSTLVVLCYGFSMGALNNVTYIRMYEFLTMLSVLLTYFVLKFIREEKIKFSIVSGILILLGFLTQYNFVFYAFFLCAAAFIVLLLKRKIRSCIIFASSAMVGVLGFFLIWPMFFLQLGKDLDSKNDAKIAAGPILFLFIFVILLSSEVGTQLWVLAIIAVLIVALRIILNKQRNAKEKTDRKARLMTEYLILLVAFVLGSLGIVYFSPFLLSRYFYITLPFFSVLLGLPFLIFRNNIVEFFSIKGINLNVNWIGVFISVGIVIGAMQFEKMSYLYLDNPEKLAVTEAVAKYPCLFFNTNYAKSITAATDHLVKFKDLYVVDDASKEGYYSYIQNHDNNEAVVVFVDTDPIVSSGLNAYEVINSLMSEKIYDSVIELYSVDSSSAFLLFNQGQ